PALSFFAGDQHTRFEGHHWYQGSAGVHSQLSKRTDVYLSGDYLRASNGFDEVIGYSFKPSTTQTQADIPIGMRHSF
ncbi:porin, partial [Burkholderia pseudomallei]